LLVRPSVTVLAPAKLNLALAVGLPQRVPLAGAPATLHPICSWMVTVNLFDELVVTRLEDDRLSRYAILWHADAKRPSDINWSVTKDLAVRAHLAMEKHVGRSLPLQLKLEKRIPVGGGLGGGSSDGAAMLRAVNELFDLELSIEELAAVGATIGSDVPFLVRGGSAIVEGFGDQITHHEIPALHVVVAFPDANCPTARVYGLFDEQRAGENGQVLRRQEVIQLTQSQHAGSRFSEGLFNDLAGAAMRAAPQMQDDLDALSRLAERRAHVTGSGSSIFVVCDNEMHALALADAVEHKLILPAVALQTCAVPHYAAR
jgi:4-diphosphocytidyl-2-C-methyl-D-erythritol kinase